jgi:type IV secretion system protein VirD4
LLQALLNLFIEQALNLQTRELPEHNPALKFQVAFILDELAAAGRIPILAQGVAYLPGYNVRLMLVIQAFSQLREIYGQQNAETMMKSLAVRIVYAPKDVAEATEISQELGFTTVKAHTHSRPLLNLADPKNQRRSVSVSEQKRPLLLPQEVKELGKNREILFYEGVRPILARKNRYYRDPLFRKRLFPPPVSAVPTARRAKRTVTPAPDPPSPELEPSPSNEIMEDSISSAPAQSIDSSPAEASSQTGLPELKIPTREATLADVDRMDSLTLDDFAVDLTGVELPEGPVSEADLSRTADRFVDAFHGR